MNGFTVSLVALWIGLIASFSTASELDAFGNVACEGDYQHHLQGVCINNSDAIYWSFTTELVKTDTAGRVLKKVPVTNHHGDLCFYKGRIYVAVNLGRFNDPNGNANSWVYVYDADSLDLISKHETQQVFHGAGGIGVMDDHLFVVGGLPDGVEENYVYEYDIGLRFVRKHVIKSGWTHLGIQTATFHNGAWWFGCYGSPQILLKTDAQFRMLGRYKFDCSLGIVGTTPDRLLVAKGPRTKTGRCLGSLELARPDQKLGLARIPETAATDRPPNFVVIFCDNLGYGDIEPFGSTVHRTPHLNRMAAEGRRFTHFYVSAGVCTPSRASLLTGCYAQRIGMHTNPRDGQVLRPVSPYGLHPDEVTIAEVLKTRGYATSIFGKWHLGDQPEFLPTRQGFDFFFGIPYSDDMTREVGQRLGERLQGSTWPELPLMKNETVIEAPADRDLLTNQCTEEALKFIDDHRNEPFFVYFAQPMPGSTRAPFASPAFKGKSRNGPWGDSIEEIDWSTGQILDRLRKHGISENTLVIWLSDNGAPMAPDMTSLGRGTNKPLHGRGYTTSEGAFRSPTIMHWPGQVEAGTTCTELATTLDLLPTVCRLSGAELPDRKIDGRDIRPLMLGNSDAQSPHESFYYYSRDQLQAVRSGPWKLFLPLSSFDRHPHFKRDGGAEPLLFHVVDDIASTTNVAASHPDVVARLTRLAEAARLELGDRGHPGAGQRRAAMISRPPKPLTLKTSAQ